MSVEVSGSLVSNHGEMRVAAACQGLGLIFCPLFFTASSLREGCLVRVLTEWRIPLAVSAVFPNARHVPAKVRIFVDHLVEHFRHPAWASLT